MTIARWEDRLRWFLIGINAVLLAQAIMMWRDEPAETLADAIEIRALAPGEMSCSCTTAPLYSHPRLYHQTELVGTQ